MAMTPQARMLFTSARAGALSVESFLRDFAALEPRDQCALLLQLEQAYAMSETRWLRQCRGNLTAERPAALQALRVCISAGLDALVAARRAVREAQHLAASVAHEDGGHDDDGD